MTPTTMMGGPLSAIKRGVTIGCMAAELIDGQALAKAIEQEVRDRAAAMSRPVHLTAILVRGTPAGELYANRQANACPSVGIDYAPLKLPAYVSADQPTQEIPR